MYSSWFFFKLTYTTFLCYPFFNVSSYSNYTTVNWLSSDLTTALLPWWSNPNQNQNQKWEQQNSQENQDHWWVSLIIGHNMVGSERTTQIFLTHPVFTRLLSQWTRPQTLSSTQQTNTPRLFLTRSLGTWTEHWKQISNTNYQRHCDRECVYRFVCVSSSAERQWIPTAPTKTLCPSPPCCLKTRRNEAWRWMDGWRTRTLTWPPPPCKYADASDRIKGGFTCN